VFASVQRVGVAVRQFEGRLGYWTHRVHRHEVSDVSCGHLDVSLCGSAGGEFTYTESCILNITLPGYEPANLQYQITSEAPASGVNSRDNFVALTTQVSVFVLVRALSEAYAVPASTFLQGVDLKETEQLIGNPDLRLNLCASLGRMGTQPRWSSTPKRLACARFPQ
jgi:hypothetical protein